MSSEEKTDNYGPIRKGLLEYAILQIVSAHRVYAGEMLARLAATDFATQEGTLYPLLSRLRREGALDYEWVESDAGPPRKYYRLTPAGAKQLEALKNYVKTLQETLTHLGEAS